MMMDWAASSRTAGATAVDGAVDGVVESPPAALESGALITSNRLKASIVDLTFFVWAIAAPVAFASRMVNSDGDLARHIAMGEYMLRNGPITVDLFSFTRAGERFVTYEWLSQILYALFHRLGGVAGVAICAGLVIATAYALVVAFMRRQGVDPLLAYLVGIGAALLGAVHWLARPHLFTFIGLVLLMFLMEARDRRALWLFPPLFVLWANLHPGFVVAFSILGVYAAGCVAEALVARADPEAKAAWLRRARYLVSGLALGGLATLLNPHGWKLHQHILALLGNSYLIDVTSEFMSVNFHAVHGKLFLLSLLLLVAVLALRRQRLTYPRLFLLLLTLYAALFAQRNIPLFGLLTLPLLTLELDADWRRVRGRALDHVRRVFQEGEAAAAPGLWFAPVVIMMVALALAQGRVGPAQIVPDDFNPHKFPIAAVEHAKSAGVSGRMYHELIWGGYILYAWPGQRIFIDGLTDFFGEDLVKDYLKVLVLEPGWDRELDAYEIDTVLIPTASPLAYALGKETAWRTVYTDDTAVIFQRTGEP